MRVVIAVLTLHSPITLISKLFSAIIQKQFSPSKVIGAFCPEKVLGIFQFGANCLPDFVVLAGNQALVFLYSLIAFRFLFNLFLQRFDGVQIGHFHR